MMSLRVLVTEDESGAADAAARELQDAGHVVLRCCERDAAAFPCAAMQDPSACPLRGAGVDVAIAVRRGWHLAPTNREEGALCAVRQHVPLLVAGPSTFNPFEPWANEVLGRTYGVVDSCERVARAPLPEHTRRAAQAAHEVLRNHGHKGDAVLVAVHRFGGRLSVQVRPLDDLTNEVRRMISVRIVAALRAYDRDATGVDVGFTGTE